MKKGFLKEEEEGKKAVFELLGEEVSEAVFLSKRNRILSEERTTRTFFSPPILRQKHSNAKKIRAKIEPHNRKVFTFLLQCRRQTYCTAAKKGVSIVHSVRV